MHSALQAFSQRPQPVHLSPEIESFQIENLDKTDRMAPVGQNKLQYSLPLKTDIRKRARKKVT